MSTCPLLGGLSSFRVSFIGGFTVIPSLTWGHPTNFSMLSGDIQYSKLYNLAEILLNLKSAKIQSSWWDGPRPDYVIPVSVCPRLLTWGYAGGQTQAGGKNMNKKIIRGYV